MKALQDIEEQGWATVPGVHEAGDLLQLATAIGKPVRNARGEIISELRIVANADARPSTLSSSFGTGTFPLHTDTAFWPTPARFLVMLAQGDIRRTTTIYPLRELVAFYGPKLSRLIERSVWVVRGMGGSVYRLMTLSPNSIKSGIRFDMQCMTPANSHARTFAALMLENEHLLPLHQLKWKQHTALVISNRFALHGRGPQPSNEQQRLLLRVYVE